MKKLNLTFSLILLATSLFAEKIDGLGNESNRSDMDIHQGEKKGRDRRESQSRRELPPSDDDSRQGRLKDSRRSKEMRENEQRQTHRVCV